MSESDIDKLLRERLAMVLDEGTEPVTADEVISAVTSPRRGVVLRSPGVSFRRPWTAIASIAAVAVLSAALIVGFVVSRRGAPPARSVGTTPTTRGAGVAPPGSILIGLQNGNLELLSPTTGRVERTVSLSPPSAAALSVTGNGRTVYVQHDDGQQSIIDRLSLSGGSQTFVVDGSDPAISPDGSELAYLPPVPINAWPRTVAVLNTRTGATRTWEMPYLPGAGPIRTPKGVNPAAELPAVSLLSWDPDGVHLAVTELARAIDARIGIELLDTSQPRASDNPQLVATSPTGQSVPEWAYGMYRGDTGQFVVIASCSPADCGSGNTTLLLDVDLRTGQSTKVGTLAGEPGGAAIAFDRSGDTFAYVAEVITCQTCLGDVPDALYRASPGSSSVIRRGTEPIAPAATAVAWVP